ncbi:Uncharacterised protein g8258 [Pycnogonum litorale]
MVALIEGYIEVSYDIGNRPSQPNTIKSNQRVDNGNWNTVIFMSVAESAMLSTDGDDVSLEGPNDSKYKVMNTNGILHLGKVITAAQRIPTTQTQGFEGYIKDIKMSNKLLYMNRTDLYGSLEVCSKH